MGQRRLWSTINTEQTYCWFNIKNQLFYVLICGNDHQVFSSLVLVDIPRLNNVFVFLDSVWTEFGGCLSPDGKL